MFWGCQENVGDGEGSGRLLGVCVLGLLGSWKDFLHPILQMGETEAGSWGWAEVRSREQGAFPSPTYTPEWGLGAPSTDVPVA